VKETKGSKKTDARIVFLDIENCPSLGWAWGKYDQNIIEFKSDWYLLSMAWKFAGESKVHVKGLVDYPGYARDRENDRRLTQDIWKVLDEADIVIGHNADRFDIRKINTRFLSHGMPPPTPYRTVDTLKIAKRYFRFDSNKLDDLGRCLGVGRKVVHTGFDLWRGCMMGKPSAWRKMKAYNVQDVILLEKVYYLLRSWSVSHPNVNHGEMACPKCGSINFQRRGFEYTLLRSKQRYQCQDCRGWFSGPSQKEGK
jgi:hypothetical protein